MTDTTVDINGYKVRRYSIIGTSHVVIDVWEPEVRGNVNPVGFAHSTITTFDVDGTSTWYGDVTTRRLPADIETMTPGSVERVAAIREYHDNLAALAISIARAAFPKDDADIVFEREGSHYITVL